MGLINEWEKIQKRKNHYTYDSGSIEHIFIYHNLCGLNEDGKAPAFIKLEDEEKKKKKSLN